MILGDNIFYGNGFRTLLKAAELYGKSPYGAHLKAVAEGKVKY